MDYNINNNRLFILGAGFSAGAGIPLSYTPVSESPLFWCTVVKI